MTTQEVRHTLDLIAAVERSFRNDLEFKHRLLAEEKRRYAWALDSVAYRMEMLEARIEKEAA